MKIKGAIFDMDGTLIDSLMFWGHLWRRIGKEYMNDEGFLPDGEVDRAVRTMSRTISRKPRNTWIPPLRWLPKALGKNS